MSTFTPEVKIFSAVKAERERTIYPSSEAGKPGFSVTTIDFFREGGEESCLQVVMFAEGEIPLIDLPDRHIPGVAA